MRSSKNCDLQFANTDRLKANYSIDITKKYNNVLSSKEITSACRQRRSTSPEKGRYYNVNS